MKAVINRLPYVRQMVDFEALYNANACFPPGHYYSPIVDTKELKQREKELWNSAPTALEGINLNIGHQQKLVQQMSPFYADIPFAFEKKEGLRYYYNNNFYSYTDALTLSIMMRLFKPKRIIEAGSGFSSAVMLDTNQLFLQGAVQLSFIEPYPERLNSLLTEQDKKHAAVIQENIQQVPLSFFESWEGNDILFIDSTHVAKTGSDVNYIFFHVLPVLKPGVLIHIHDIFYPFEYPKDWVLSGRNWNEAYMLRAFLTNNNEYEVLFFADYLHKNHSGIFSEMPLFYKSTGANFWMRKK